MILSFIAILINLKYQVKPGTKFNYNTAESNVIGGIVRAATGQNLIYLFRKENMATFWNGV